MLRAREVGLSVVSYPRALALHTERDPTRVALVHEGQALRRGELDRRSNRLARAYAEQGVREGDLVGARFGRHVPGAPASHRYKEHRQKNG